MTPIIGDDANNFLEGTNDGDYVDGVAGNDVLYGYGGNDTILGGAGFDFLDGGPGNDMLDGGEDGDTAGFQSATSGLTVDLNISGAQDVGGGLGFDTLVSIENLTGTNYGDVLIGDSISNGLTGRAGNDTLVGGAAGDGLEGGVGDDVLDGGAGIDQASYLSLAIAGVTVDLRVAGPQAVGGGLGIDTLISIENVRGSNFDDTLIGNDEANVLSGFGGNDVLDGQGGIDMANYAGATGGVSVSLLRQNSPQDIGGGFGVDTLISIENIRGSIYADTLTGDSNANLLQGSLGNDVLSGGRGDDTITGGPDADVVFGGSGADTFFFGAGHVASGASLDKIGDFRHRQGDKIDLSTLDAVDGGADDPFSFIGRGSFTGVAGELHCARTPGGLVLEGDTNGDGAADFAISVLGVSRLTLSDLIL